MRLQPTKNSLPGYHQPRKGISINTQKVIKQTHQYQSQQQFQQPPQQFHKSPQQFQQQSPHQSQQQSPHQSQNSSPYQSIQKIVDKDPEFDEFFEDFDNVECQSTETNEIRDFSNEFPLHHIFYTSTRN